MPLNYAVQGAGGERFQLNSYNCVFFVKLYFVFVPRASPAIRPGFSSHFSPKKFASTTPLPSRRSVTGTLKSRTAQSGNLGVCCALLPAANCEKVKPLLRTT